MDLNLEKDIVAEINNETATISYDLPYVLLKEQWNSLVNLVENAPIAYSLEMTESPCYPGGVFLRLIKCA
ncbi:MAG: hypothetical protein IJB90_01790 [Clostridia bacterium]|nr:hypothetical protein [Clostridia bacterium]